MSKARFPIEVVLSSLFVTMIIFSQQIGFTFVDSEPDESEIGVTTVICILVGYLLYLLRYFVINEGRKYTVPAFSISVILSTVGVIIYDQQVGGWFWNDDWVLEDALFASIRPILILLLLNEFFGVAERGIVRIANAGQVHITGLTRIGVIASLPLAVVNPPFILGMFILIPTLILFFIFYWASTDTPLSLNGN
ncbi:MAG: hypothetical protein CMA30_05640 [Euryarchaeota archaeon]|nr:hypothetical protein [Euryarchaeota archaeon]